MPEQVEAVAETLGETSERHIAHDRSLVEFTRLTVSNPDLASRSIAELNLPVRFGAVVTRVRRGDLELLARDDLVLEPGDRLAVGVERRRSPRRSARPARGTSPTTARWWSSPGSPSPIRTWPPAPSRS